MNRGDLVRVEWEHVLGADLIRSNWRHSNSSRVGIYIGDIANRQDFPELDLQQSNLVDHNWLVCWIGSACFVHVRPIGLQLVQECP